MNLSTSALLLLSVVVGFGSALRPPCSLRNGGVICVNDEDCAGPQSTCVGGYCACPNNFELYALDQQTRQCRPAPANVNDKCQSACRAPLVCQDDKCVCWKAQVVNGKCVVNCPSGQTLVGQECRAVSGVGGKCQQDLDCNAPFTFCKGGSCQCVPGATRKGNACSATCPNNGQPGQICRKKYINDGNIMENDEDMDTCPKGQFCVTYGKPDIGHCCPIQCPYGNPDGSKTCKAGASASSKCPEQSTHYCQRIETKGSVQKLCCPRPCREPTPLYINGECLPLSHWNEPCSATEQCEGGATMSCSNGRCNCKQGFAQRNYTFPTCEASCNGLSSVSVNGNCYPKAGLGEPCVHDLQCPGRAHCREGVCECDCGYLMQRGGCGNPDDPFNIDGLLSGFQKILGGPNSAQTGR